MKQQLRGLCVLAGDVFPYALIFYLILFLLENFFPGFVSNNFSLNYILYGVIGLCVISIFFLEGAKKEEKDQEVESFVINHKTLPIVVVITFIGAMLRLYHLAYKSLWFDEAVLYWIAQGSLKQVITNNAVSNSAPMLYAAVIHFISMINNSEFSLRFLSALAGIISIPVFYIFARNFFSRRISYFVTLLVTIAPYQIFYSQELREYSLTFLLSTIMLYCYDKYRKGRTNKNLILLTIISLIGLFTQYGLVILILSFNILFFISLIRHKVTKNELFKWIASQLILLLGAFLVYQSSLKFQFRAGGFAADSYLATVYAKNIDLLSIITLAKNGFYNLINFFLNIDMLLYPLLIAGLYGFLTQKDKFHKIALISIPFLVNLVLAIFKLYPFGSGRQNMFLIPLMFILLGYSLNVFWKIKQKLFFWIIFGILCFYNVNASVKYLQSVGGENMKQILAKIEKSIKPNDKIYIYYASSPAFRYYYHGNSNPVIYGICSRYQMDVCKKQILEKFIEKEKVWFVGTHCYENECQEIQKTLDSLSK